MFQRAFGRLAAFLLITLIATDAWADGLPKVRPEEVGLSSERLRHIDDFYTQRVKKGELAGVVLLVARHGKVAHLSATGFANVATGQKLEPDTIFRLYSMTKPIAATALMMLYEEGRFKLDDPISKYLPEFSKMRVLRTPTSPVTDTAPAEREPTIHDLLRHSAGFGHGADPKNVVDAEYIKAKVLDSGVSLADAMASVAKVPLLYQPGTKYTYSLAPDIEARLVEVMSGMSFEAFLKTRMLGPLGMKDTAFWLMPDKAPRLSAVHWSKNGKLAPVDKEHGSPPRMELDQINTMYTVDHARKGGSFGLVGTAEDYWRFAQMMANGGDFEGKRYLSPATVHYMARDHLSPVPYPGTGKEPSGITWGLGFAVVKDAAVAGGMRSDGTFFWAGAATTTFWIDPKEDLVVVVMTQHMAADQATPDLLFSQVPALVYGALEK